MFSVSVLRPRLLGLLAGLALAGGTAAAADAGNAIQVQASATYVDADNNTLTLQSNVVVANVTGGAPTILFYTDSTFTKRAYSAGLGKPLYVGVDARSCNRDDTTAETLTVDLWSGSKQQKVTVQAIETAPDSGQFYFQVPTGGAVDAQETSQTSRVFHLQIPTNGGAFRALAVGSVTPAFVPADTNDVLQAHVEGCGYGEASTDILIDPRGIVFDSGTNVPVPGALVSLIDVSGAGNGGNAGGPAAVFQEDGSTPSPSTVTTDSTGAYAFPMIPSGTYRLDVVAPSGYSFPSQVPPNGLPGVRNISATGSYHASFDVNINTGDVLVDIPVDEMARGLYVTKTASRPTAEIAESVGYTVIVRNVGSTTMDGIQVTDTLPKGFGYLAQSTTIDSLPAGEPTGRNGATLTFQVPAIAVGQMRTLRYRATIGPLALQGDGINRAQASAALPSPTISNVAAATVQVQQGVFTDRAMVLGKVFADCNANGVQDAGEPGVPGVRLFMEDGSFVVTDGQGQYSFYGISPRTHVLKLDATTLPPGMTPLATSSRNAGDGASRFVDPHNGELHRADFALGGCSKAADALIALRASNNGNELGAALKMDFRADGGVLPAGDVRAQPAAGLVGAAQGNEGAHPAAAHAPARDAAAAASSPEPTLEQRIAALDNTLAFLDLHDGQALAATQATVRVKGSSQVVLALLVDGQEVGAERIGTRVQDESRQIQARDYVGVPLPAGDHELALVAKDGFGNVRGRVAIKVRAPGNLAHIAFDVPATSAPADGESLVPVKIRLTDARGVPVMARTPVTIETSAGEFDVVDLDPKAPGIQIFVEGGVAELPLRAPRAPGAAELHAVSGSVSGKASVSFTPALRPMIAAGIVEGAFNFRRLSANSITSASANDGFEAQLSAFATNGTGDNSVNGRAAMFLKGKVLGSSLLTVGYDSDKESNQALFRDIQPDQFYPVYGDASVKGFDAQSTSHLYVRLEHDKSYMLYGDFTTQSDDPARQLGAYQRSLTGGKVHVDDGPVGVNAWVSRTTSQQVIDEIAANGTSGPFMLSAGQPVDGSAKVEIIARDHNQPALIVRDTTLANFTDYDIDALTGRLLLHAPVASFDADLDPQFIRVTYEAETGGPSFTVAGIDAKVKLGDKVAVGMALVMDKDPLDTMQLSTVNATFKPDEHTTLTVEGAHTAHDLTGDRGDAQRVELKHEDDKLKILAQAAHTDATFENASSTIAKGRNEADLKASYAMGDKTRLVVDAASSGDATTGDRRNGLLVGVERSVDGGVKVEVGARHVQDRPGAEAVDGTSTNSDTSTVRAKVSAPVPGVSKATAFVEGEQDIHDADKRLVAVGGDYRLTTSSRVYARQEIVSSLTGELDLDAAQHRNTTLVGIDSDVTHDTHLFSEYRVRDAIDGREAEAALGLRNQYALAEGVRLNTSFERVRALDGSDTDDNLAVTAALEYTRDPLTKASGRVELRDSTSSRGALSTLGLAHKIDADWTLLGRNAYALTESKTGGATQMQERFQLGLAYRDTTTNRVNGLARYEFKREDGGTDFERRAVHILSSHADLQIARGFVLTGEYAAKHDLELVDGRWIAGNAQLASVRVTRDLGERWDMGVAARVLGNASLSQRTAGIGAELGYRVIENLWVSAGYNFSGFRDRDLADDGTTQAGIYLRVRFKFDESLFGGKSDASAKGAP